MIERTIRATMIKAGPDERIYPVAKIATIVDALAAEGVSPTDALKGIHVSPSAISSPTTRVSLNQVIECYRTAVRLSRDPRFACHAGLRFHLSTYGMYGFAILSSTDFRQTMRFIVQYHQLATPTAEISFKEAGDWGVWTFVPIPHPRVDARLYKFIVELQFAIRISLQRDVMGAGFVARELHVTYGPPDDAQTYPEAFGCPVLFNRSANELVFDAKWLDGTPELGNEITYSETLKLCKELLEELELRIGIVGKVREILLANLMRPTSFDAVARRLHITTRTLRRKLREENMSFRKLVDELRMHTAIKYLRDTHLTNQEIARALGFSDAANFRHAFRRWTKRAPLEFRGRGAFRGVPRHLTPDPAGLGVSYTKSVDRDRWSRPTGPQTPGGGPRPPWLRAIRRAAAVAADTKAHEPVLMVFGISTNPARDIVGVQPKLPVVRARPVSCHFVRT